MKKKYFILLLMMLTALQAWTQSYSRTSHGMKVKVGSMTIELQIYSPGVVRVLKSAGETSSAVKSFSVIAKPSDSGFRLRKEKNALYLMTASLLVKVDLRNGSIQYYDRSERLVMAERPTAGVIPAGQATKAAQGFEIALTEAIYGLGQHQDGVLNYRNHSVTLRQRNMEIAVPFFITSGNYGIFWDNCSETTFTDSSGIASFESVAGNAVDYYFIKGKNADGVIAGMRMLTGQVPMFPKWVFGFWQSRERYTSQQQLIDVIKKYRELKVPLDGIVQDWQYWGEGNEVWNSTEFGNPAFPEPRKMIDSVHTMNAHMIISVWPNFGKNTEIYHDLQDKELLYDFKTWPESSAVKVYDAFSPEARNIYWKHINKNLFAAGIDGWWLDATEPEQSDPGESDSARTFAGTFKFLRNAYPLVTTAGVYENQRKTDPDKRVFILTRSAFAGQQRNATMTWSGDIQCTWDVFRRQIPAGLNLSLSGIPYWNTDIGGFFAFEKYPEGVKDPAFHEIYTRWFEFAAFTPMLRSHGTNTPREIYQFGKKGDWAYDAQEKFIRLRYRFLPYIYSESWQVSGHSSTMMRALMMDFASDFNVHTIDNQYMFGKSVLVAPVTDSMYVNRAEGKAVTDFGEVKSVKVYLPSGSGWTDFWSGKKYPGGGYISCAAPIDQIPLFVKNGSILPLEAFQQYTSELVSDTLELRIYPGADGRFILYEDENDTYHYEKGIYATVELKWNDKTRTLTINDRNGSFPGMLTDRIFNVVLVSDATRAGSGLLIRPGKMVKYVGKKLKVVL